MTIQLPDFIKDIDTEKGFPYFVKATYFLWIERPVQSISSFSLGTGWVYSLIKKDLTPAYEAFGWIPWPIAATLASLIGWGWLLGTIYAGEKSTTHLVWAQGLIWVMVAAHMNPVLQTTGFITYSLMAGALFAQSLRAHGIIRYQKKYG